MSHFVKFIIMKNKIANLCCLVTLLMTFVNVSAQNEILGRVVNEEGKGMPLVNVVLVSMSDSTFVTGVTTDSLGGYSMKVVDGTYIVRYSMLGYCTVTNDIKMGGSMTLGTVMLKQSPVELEGITVTRYRSPFRINSNGLDVDVEHDKYLSRQNDIYELLGKIPGVFSSGQSVQVLGKGSPVFYINGRKVTEQGEVENLSVDQIRKVRVVRVNDVRYDSDGAAVIDIRTKRPDEGLAFNTTANLTQSSHTSQKYGLSSSYSTGKLDVLLDYNYRNAKGKANERQTTKISADTIWNKVRMGDNIKNTELHHVKAGLAYHLTKDSEIGVKYTGSFGSGNGSVWDSLNVENNYGDKNVMKTDKFSRNNTNTHHINVYGDMNLPKDWKINVSLDYINMDSKNRNRIKEEDFTVSNIAYLNQSKWDVMSASLHASRYFENGSGINVGYDFSHTKGNNVIEYEGMQNVGRTDDKEIKNAFFLSYELPLGQFTLNAGLRYELLHNRLNGNDGRGDMKHTEHKFLPTFGVSYFKGNLMQTLSYSVSTNRPYFDEYNENFQYVNRYEYQKGNNALQSETVHDLSYMLMYKSLYLVLGYSYSLNPWMNNSYSMKGKSSVIISTQENLRYRHDFTAMINFHKEIKWWSPSWSMAVMKSILKYPGPNGTEYSDGRPMVMLNMDNDFTLPGGYILSANYHQNFKGYLQMLRIYSSSSFNVSLKKSLFKDRLRLSFDAYDIFNGERNHSIWRINDIVMDSYTKNDTRKFGVTLTYRFRENKTQKKNTSAEVEMKRLKFDSAE